MSIREFPGTFESSNVSRITLAGKLGVSSGKDAGWDDDSGLGDLSR